MIYPHYYISVRKNRFLTIILCLFAVTLTHAHAMWIETLLNGEVGQEQEVKVYFGEFSYGIREQVGSESFDKMKNFKLYVIDCQGNKVNLNTSPSTNCYVAKFMPESEGVYTFVMDNDNIEVIDYTKYDFGKFKTHYHSTAITVVEEENGRAASMNPTGLSITPFPSYYGKIKLHILFKGQPMMEKEVEVSISDNWNKKLKTNKDGFVYLTLPFDTKYMVEVAMKEEVSGNYKGKDYEFIWHAATLMLEQK